MATPLPAPFKAADISRFTTRAKQLEQFRPVIAYWCNYYVVNQILNKGLHTESDECMNYTTTLMDKLEAFKSANLGNDTVHDDIAAQAYVEQFALETFSRGDNAVRANKVTAQTAEAFLAAATFLDLLAIWQTPLDREVATKSKYAKFHAVRIAKAIKAGEDPNLSNPIQEQPPTPATLDATDPDVQKITGLQPSVEDGSDHSQPPSFVDRPPPSTQLQTGNLPHAHPEVSPLEPSSNEGYFPTVPTFTSEDTAPSLPTADSSADIIMTSPNTTAPPALSPFPQDFYNVQPPPTTTQPGPSSLLGNSPLNPATNAAPTPSFQAPVPPPAQPFLPSQQPPLQAPAPPSSFHNHQQPPTSAIPPPQRQQYRTDDEAVMAAQKHAKWAISALNFEDVDTAVRELRIALAALGAEGS